MQSPKPVRGNEISNPKPPALAVYAADYWEHACPMLRVLLPAEAAGVRVLKGTTWSEGVLHSDPGLVEQAGLVLITRDFPRWSREYEEVVSRARQTAKPVVYELDDLLLEIPEEHPDYEYYAPARSGILQAVVEADAVIGSTPSICEYLREFNPRVHLWENFLDDRTWKFTSPRLAGGASPVQIGYMGGESHLNDLALVQPVLERLLRRYPSQVVMRFWGIEPPAGLRALGNVDWIPVAIVDYAEFAGYFQQQQCDAFIAPLQDNRFNRAKSPIKFLEYSALGAPGVYSRLAPYQRVIRHGENGLLAASPDEWEGYLTRLVEEPELRLALGSAAQSTVRESWMLARNAQGWAEILGQVAETPSPGGGDHTTRNVARKMAAFQREEEDALRRTYAEKKQSEALTSQLLAKDRLILEIDAIAQKYFALYQDVMHSQSWHFMERLIRLRLRIAPRGSPQANLLGAFYRVTTTLFRHGFAPFWRQLRYEVRRRPAAGERASQVVKPVLYQGPFVGNAPARLPAITILHLQGPEAGSASSDRILSWLEAQTLPACAELIVWDQATGEVFRRDDRETFSRAESLQTLLQSLQTRYVCLASEGLLQQEETYLEANLIALQSERLAFTLNLRSSIQSPQADPSELLPNGGSDLPLSRMVIRSDCLREDFSIDFSAWKAADPDLPAGGKEILSQSPPRLAGKLLLSSRNGENADPGSGISCRIAEPLSLVAPYWILGGGEKPEAGALFQTLIPVHEALLPKPEPTDLATVFLVMPFLAVGGAEKIALKVMENLADRIRWVVLTFEHLDPALGTTTEQFRRITPYVYELPDFIPVALFESCLEYLIRRFDPLAIYIANGTAWIYEALSSLKHLHPSIRTINQVYDYQVGWINRYDARLLLYLDAHIGSNPRICQAYLDKGVRPEQVFYIENGTDPQELDPAAYDQARIDNLKIQLELPRNTKIVTFASRLNPQKRPLDFIELARRFSLDSSVAFLMLGDGPLAGTVDQQIRKINLTNLQRRPFYTPISDILALSDVLVLPSEYEGMPMIVIEAQTMGVPVVATDVGNVRDLLTRTGGGVVVPQIGDISGLMAAVRQMLDRAPRRAQIRQNTLENFSWKICAEKHLPPLLGAENA